jgi:hypothetical protein
MGKKKKINPLYDGKFFYIIEHVSQGVLLTGPHEDIYYVEAKKSSQYSPYRFVQVNKEGIPGAVFRDNEVLVTDHLL